MTWIAPGRRLRRAPGAGTYCLADGRRFEGKFVDRYATRGTYVDKRGARFAVEMQYRTCFSAVAQAGDAAFKSKAPLQAAGPAAGCEGASPD